MLSSFAFSFNLRRFTSSCPKNAKIGRNTWVIGLANSATSLFAGLIIFSYLGYLVGRCRVPVSNSVLKVPWMSTLETKI